MESRLQHILLELRPEHQYNSCLHTEIHMKNMKKHKEKRNQLEKQQAPNNSYYNNLSNPLVVVLKTY
jgi:hypothetical protein